MPPPTQPPAWLDLLSHPRVSQAMGVVVRVRPPRPVLKAAIHMFSKTYGVNLAEAERPVSDYDSFQAFFTRRLKPGLRPIDAEVGVVPSPCDGVLSACGPLGRGTLIQAKGVEYTLDALLGGSLDADPYRGGTWAVGYLAPKNYHRVHSPWRGRIVRWRYLPGALYPVNRLGLDHVHGVFARNERLVAHCETEFGPAALVMVGATCVGHMRVCFTELCANEGQPGSGLCTLEPPLDQARGDEFGVFEMGSTVVLVFANPGLEAVPSVPASVRVGEAFLRMRPARP
ncbi:MAG: phosphatidylserine decarboxylase [Myxococcales bacterium]|nr:phosphatidylserine decarboxylase [Myxococcales bacterium]